MNGAQTADDDCAIDDLMARVPVLKLAFVFFLIHSSWALLAILTAVVSDNIIVTTSQQDVLLQLQLAEETHKEHVRQLDSILSGMGFDQDGQLDKDEIEEYLKDEAKFTAFAHICQVSASGALEVLELLSQSRGIVERERLIECFTVAGNPITQKSILKFESGVGRTKHRRSEQAARLDEIEWRCHELGADYAQRASALARLEGRSRSASGASEEAKERLHALDHQVDRLLAGVAEARSRSVVVQLRSVEARVEALNAKGSLAKDLLLELCRKFNEQSSSHWARGAAEAMEQPRAVN